MKTRLGRQDTLLLAYAQMREQRTLRTGELTGPLRLSRNQERELFSRLTRGGLIARVRPGALLERAGVDAKWLRKPERALRPTSSMIAWIPKRSKRGSVNRRWGVVMNGEG